MDIKKRMELKWEEITTTKNEREALFDNFEANKDRISELHFEGEIKKLQYMFLKREQLAEIKRKALDHESVESIEKINETCIELVQKQLIDHGYEERLKQEGLHCESEVKCEMCGTTEKVGTHIVEVDGIIAETELCDGCFHETEHDEEFMLRDQKE